MINFDSLKTQFITYLEQIKGSEKSDEETQDFSEISIFSYMNEFEDFLEQEMNIDLSQMQISTEELIGMEYNELNQILFPEGEEQTQEQEIMSGLIGELLNNENVENEEGRTSLLQQISGQDGNNENISLADIIAGFENIQPNSAEEVSEGEKSPEVEEVEQPDETESSENTSETEASSSSSTGGSSTGGGTISTPTTNSTPTTVETKDLSQMSEKELKEELSTAETNKTEAQNNLNSYIDGTNEEIMELDEELQQVYENYQKQLEEVDVEMAKQVDDKKNEINEQQGVVREKQSAVSEQTSVVNEAEATLTDCKNTVASLESTLASLESIDTSDMEDGEAAAVAAQISAVQAELSAAQAAQAEAETALAEEKEELETKKQEEDDEIAKLGELEGQMQDLEAQIAEKHPEIVEAMQEYSDGRRAVSQYKIESLSAAREAFSASERYVNDINSAIKNVQNEEKSNERIKSVSPNPMAQYDKDAGKHIADTALDYATRKNTTGLCWAGVHSSLMQAFGLNQSIPAEYGSAYQAVELFRGEVDAYKDVAKHFVEVPNADLNDLPLGAVIIWDKGGNSSVSAAGKEHGHISIYQGKDEKGNLKESSDHVGKINTNRGTDYTVFIPISV